MSKDPVLDFILGPKEVKPLDVNAWLKEDPHMENSDSDTMGEGCRVFITEGEEEQFSMDLCRECFDEFHEGREDDARIDASGLTPSESDYLYGCPEERYHCEKCGIVLCEEGGI